jgi:hypothetical protein
VVSTTTDFRGARLSSVRDDRTRRRRKRGGRDWRIPTTPEFSLERAAAATSC